MPLILIASQQFSYTVERKRMKSLRLRLKSTETFAVSCPKSTPDSVIITFITSHAQWIIKHASSFKTKTILSDLKFLTILDIQYQIITTKTTRDSIVVYHDEQKIYVNTTSLSHTYLQTLYNKKLRPLALKLIKAELKELSAQHGFKPGSVSVRNQSTRFGSCSYQGNLSFNWQIIFFPKPIFTHIILHELTHLNIKNHSSEFWHQLAIYDPDYKKHNLWLKNEGTKYFIIN